MKISPDISSAVIDAFTARGFQYKSRSRDGRYVLTGSLKANEGAHFCEIKLRPDFSSPPKITLLEIPVRLKPIAPHLNSKGSLCYLSKSSVSLNIFDPVGQMIACLERAEFVLGQMLRNEVVEDLAEEFFAYWGEDYAYCYFDFNKTKSKNLKCMYGEYKNNFMIFFITDNPDRSQSKVDVLGYPIQERDFPVIRIVHEGKSSPTSGKWRPKNLSELLDWQTMIDSRSSRKIYDRLAVVAK